MWCGEAIASRVEAKLLDLGDREGPASCEGDTKRMGSIEAAMAVIRLGESSWRTGYSGQVGAADGPQKILAFGSLKSLTWRDSCEI